MTTARSGEGRPRGGGSASGRRHGRGEGIRAAALALAAVAWVPAAAGAALLWERPVQAAPARAKIGGTWDLTWKNRRGETRRGLIIVEQRGSQLSARMPDRDNATATGSISGTSFSLHGSRLGLPITITGRVAGRRMTGILTALGVERRFTGVRRRR